MADSNIIDKISPGKKTLKTSKQKCEEKQLYEYFKLQTSKIAHGKTRTWLTMGNLMREA